MTAALLGFSQPRGVPQQEPKEDEFPAQETASNVHGVGNGPSNAKFTVASILQHYGQFGDLSVGIRQSVNSFSEFLFRKKLGSISRLLEGLGQSYRRRNSK
jgi:hypothetical protein